LCEKWILYDCAERHFSTLKNFKLFYVVIFIFICQLTNLTILNTDFMSLNSIFWFIKVFVLRLCLHNISIFDTKWNWSSNLIFLSQQSTIHWAQILTLFCFFLLPNSCLKSVKVIPCVVSLFFCLWMKWKRREKKI
jgi:hypothetical protein